MKRTIKIFLLTVFLLAGCAKDNPSNEDLISALQQQESISAYISQAEEYSAVDDPDQLLGGAHQYVSKIALSDGRYEENGEPEIFIEVFRNSQDAAIRYDYLQLINQCRKEYCEKNDLRIDGSDALKQAAVYQNGNIVMKASENMGANVAEAYFKAMDSILGDTEYKQTDTLKEEAYTALHKEMAEDQKSSIETAIRREADECLRIADQNVNRQLDAYEAALTDTNQRESENLIQKTYQAEFFAQKRTEWESRLNALNELKQTNEAEYQSHVDEINALIADAKADPTQEKYDHLDEVISGLETNYYYNNFTYDWNKKMQEIADALVLIERDKNAAAVEDKLKRIEETLNTSLYDEVTELVSQYKKDSLYKDYTSEWQRRLDALEEQIETQKHKEKIKAFKDSCKTISYKEFSRNSDQYEGTPVHFKGEVVQVVDQDSSGAELRVNVTQTGTYYTYYTDTIYVIYDSSDEISVTKILEDDIIEIWGLGGGDVSYTSVLGSKITIPLVYAQYIKVK